LSKLFYNLFLFLYSAGIRVTALWNPKAQQWLDGRRGIFTTINNKQLTTSHKLVWMHCASLGEFEQGRPLLEEL
jgi:3-deoxy-D-manno-octulosonic-acid transferase